MEELEVFKIENGIAFLSYRLKNIPLDDLNNGYRYMEIPYNPRELQLSARGNILVNQSVTTESQPKSKFGYEHN